MTFTLFSRAALIGLAMTTAASCSAEPSKMRTDEELGEFVKAYLMENPEVILEAVQAYQERLDAEADAAKVAALPSIMMQADALPTIGPKEAPVTIVEFFDYNCGFCKRATSWVLAEADDENQDIRVIFIDLPILSPTSVTAARASLAADIQGRYREFHSLMMKAPSVSVETIYKVAGQAGLDVDKLKADMNSDAVTQRLDQNISLARQAGVEATPGFFIGEQFYSGFNPPRLEAMIEDARKIAG